MRTLALQRYRLPLSALAAFIILLLMQGYFAFAYEIGGTNGLGEALIMSGVGQSQFVIDSSLAPNSDQEIVDMPSVTTGAASLTKNGETSYHFILNGSISNMGVASSTNYAFRWGYTPATMTNVVGAGVAVAAGSFSVDIGNIIAGTPVYYQFYNTVGAVEAAGSTQSGTGAATGTSSTSAIIPLLVLMVGIVVILKMMANGQVNGLYGLLLIFVIIMITVAILTSTNVAVNTP